jgi:spore coat protein CotF
MDIMVKMNNKQLYSFFHNQPKNIITAVDGDRGTGKTIVMTDLLAINPDLPKYVNYKVELPNIYPLEVSELLDLKSDKRIMVCITESTTLLDSMKSNTHLGQWLSYVSMQSRKIGLCGVDVIIDMQVLSTIQSRFMTQVNMYIHALGLGEKGFYYIVSKENLELNPFANRQLKYLPFKEAYQIKDVYNTMERFKPPNVEELKVNVMSQEKKKVLVDGLVKEILSHKEKYGIRFKTGKAGNTITMKQISSILLDMGKSDDLSYYLHPKINMELLKVNK